MDEHDFTINTKNTLMNIVKERVNYFHNLENLAPKQLKKLFNFGWQTLTTHAVLSLRSNSRLLDLNWNTAKSKAYRLTSNLKFLALFLELMLESADISRNDCIAIDFSDFGNGHMVLMFAKQTHKGRGIPIYFEILEKSNSRGFQNTFILQALKNFEALLGFKPKLVFDRGFACPSIIRYLCDNSWNFCIRIKKCKKVFNIHAGKNVKIKDSAESDFECLAYEQKKKLRIIISDLVSGQKEPWYLITNDFKSNRETIIKRYYYRFEIEELFRDGKRLLGLEGVTFKNWQSLAVTLWFVVAGLWFFWWCEDKFMANLKQEKKLRQQMGLSVIRYWFEKLRNQIYQLGLKAALENSA
jgi:hypothetical protein